MDAADIGSITAMYTLTSALGFLGGLWSATFLQDRETRRRHVGIARALLAEVTRISSEVGAHNPAYISMSIHGAKPRVPSTASWVQGLAIDYSSTNPAVLPRFMELERFLANLGAADVAQDAVCDRVATLKEAIGVHRDNHDLVGQMTTEGQLSQAQQNLNLAQFTVDVDFKNVVGALNDLRQFLRDDEKLLASQSRPHLRSSRRRRNYPPTNDALK